LCLVDRGRRKIGTGNEREKVLNKGTEPPKEKAERRGVRANLDKSDDKSWGGGAEKKKKIVRHRPDGHGKPSSESKVSRRTFIYFSVWVSGRTPVGEARTA